MLASAIPPPEYHRPVYRNLYNTGAMSGVGMADASMGVIMVVGSVQEIPRPRLGYDDDVGDGGCSNLLSIDS